MPDFLETVDQSVLRAISHGVAHCRAEDERFDGRTVRVADRELLQFASCSSNGGIIYEAKSKQLYAVSGAVIIAPHCWN